MCIYLLLHGKRWTVTNDEWELYAKSESDVNESVNPLDFGFA